MEIGTIEQIVLKERAQADLISFCVLTDKFFERNAHHVVIAKKLQDFMEGKIKRLILQTPPRSGKSRLVCEAIAHAMGKLENTDIIYTGHSIGLLEAFSRNIRGRIDSQEYKAIFPVSITDGNSALQQWSTTNNNQLMIFGVGGGITGRGGNRLIIDDPYATRQDAESDTIRAKVFEWYNSTFYSRRHNQDAGICVIMQRWREDDLVGELLKQDNWEVVKIPAIEDGHSFWESRFSVSELENIRKQIGNYFFMSQYQQEPFSDGTGTFKSEYFQYYTEKPVFSKVYTFLDPAISLKQEADYSAIVTIGVTRDNNIYVLDIFRDRVEPDALIDNLLRIADTYKPNTIGIETVQFQKMLALEIKKQMKMRNAMYHIYEMKPTGEKEARIRSVLQPRYSLKTMFHRRDGVNVEELEMELIKFPNGKHDDICDALASCIAMANIELEREQPEVPKTMAERIDMEIFDDEPEDDLTLSPY